MLNKDAKRRDEILGTKNKKYVAGIKRFKDISLDLLEIIIKEGFLSLEDKPNFSPSAQEIYDFILKNPDFTAIGYLVSPDREDYRMSLDGVELNRKPEYGEIVDFVKLFRFASVFKCDAGGCHAFFDSSLIPSNFKKQKV